MVESTEAPFGHSQTAEGAYCKSEGDCGQEARKEVENIKAIKGVGGSSC